MSLPRYRRLPFAARFAGFAAGPGITVRAGDFPVALADRLAVRRAAPSTKY